MRVLCSGLVGLSMVAATQAAKYGYNYVKVNKDSDIVAKNFQDVEGLKLYSPAFTDKKIPAGFSNGTSGPTSDKVLDAYIRRLANENDWIHYDTADFGSEEGRAFPYARLFSGSASEQDGKIRVWIQGGVHGNEPAGDQSVLALLGALSANETWASSILEKLDIFLLPRYNPDGVYYFQRTFATNFDPNRDHVKLARQQTQSIKSLFNNFNPHIAIDMHEYTADRQYGTYKHGSDGLFSAAKNLNIHPDIRSLSEDLFAKKIGEAMEARDLRWEPYIESEVEASTKPGYEIVFAEAGSDARIGRNAMGLTQCVTFLLETRGIRLADQEFQRRTAAALTMMTSILQTAVDNASKVLSTINAAVEDFIVSKQDIIITDYSELIDRKFTLVDVNNGSIVQAPIRFRPSTPKVANFTRTRPEAYIIPSGWSDVAAKLRVAGLEVQKLDKVWKGKVEALTVTSISFSGAYYEGSVLATVVTDAATKQKELPQGSFLVSTRQKNGGLAVVALEPEGEDSYARTNIIPLSAGDEYPIFRVIG